jgi:hypothetical protein
VISVIRLDILFFTIFGFVLPSKNPSIYIQDQLETKNIMTIDSKFCQRIKPNLNEVKLTVLISKDLYFTISWKVIIKQSVPRLTTV